MGGLSIHMSEAGVTLTDYGLVCECVVNQIIQPASMSEDESLEHL